MFESPFKFSPSVWLLPTFLVLSIWTSFLLDALFNLHLNNHGIYPRTLSGLQGIVFSPFLHADLNHITNNTFPLFILSMALIYFYRDLSLKVLFLGILTSGFLTWIIGRNSIHIGASSLIYVLVSFLFFKGFYTRYFRLMALSFAVVLVYGSMIWYVFPQIDNQNISWEGHLAGLLTGFAFAKYFKTPEYKETKVYDWQKPDFNPDQDDFAKHFDENGNFAPKPKVSELQEDDLDVPKFIYHFKESDQNKPLLP
jgi:membrane associated rhomboid family serine protease